MKLETLTLDQCERVRQWRNNEMEVWRTPFMLTREMQVDFYSDIICNRDSNHRYWAIVRTNTESSEGCRPITEPYFIGMGGITYIAWENRIGEITLIIDPDQRKDGLGEKAVDLLLDQAFNHLNLQTVFGETYMCNPLAETFWKKITGIYMHGTDLSTSFAYLPNRKYWQGRYYSSLYFSISKDDFNAKCNRNK